MKKMKNASADYIYLLSMSYRLLLGTNFFLSFRKVELDKKNYQGVNK